MSAVFTHVNSGYYYYTRNYCIYLFIIIVERLNKKSDDLKIATKLPNGAELWGAPRVKHKYRTLKYFKPE